VYSKCDVLLFDDPLSAVDANVGEHIMTKGFVDALKGTTRVLVMNQLYFLPKYDVIYMVVVRGTWAELSANSDLFKSLIKEHQSELCAGERCHWYTQGASRANGPSCLSEEGEFGEDWRDGGTEWRGEGPGQNISSAEERVMTLRQFVTMDFPS
jgi:hypothetical protein